MKKIFFIQVLFFAFNSLWAETIITYRVNESSKDSRYNYDYEVLKLALEKTKAKHGDYQLIASMPMNFSRAMAEVKNNRMKNFIFKSSYEDSLENTNIGHARFPVDLDIVGYRVCFTSKDNQYKTKNIKTIEDLKKLKLIQGASWADVKILKSAGLSVTENVEYESLFIVTALGRFDLFCRGANEILSEYEAHKNIPNLTLDENLVIYYDLPRVFYGNKASAKELNRIEEGLKIAYEDGSLIKLWKKEYGASVAFSNLDKRVKISIPNPLIKAIDFDYKKYDIHPMKMKFSKEKD